MTRTESEIRQELAACEQYAEQVTQRLEQITGQRDALVAELLDVTGASSDRYVGAR